MSKPTVHDPRVEAEKYCVRDVDEPDLGVVERWHATKATELERMGIGHDFADATDEIEERVDLEEHVGETVATVLIDFDSRDQYSINWHVDRSLRERLREVLPI